MGKVSITVQDLKLELSDYEESATISDLAYEVEAVRPAAGLITEGCAGCGICCGDTIPVFREDIVRLAQKADISTETYIQRFLHLPSRIDAVSRAKTIEEQMLRDGLTEEESALLYDFNVGDPISPQRREDGKCAFLDENLCTIYAGRPFICMLYVCNADERLAAVHANIVRQGIWDSYRLTGWITEKEIPFNPFTRFETLNEIPIRLFEYDMDSIMEKLANYF